MTVFNFITNILVVITFTLLLCILVYSLIAFYKDKKKAKRKREEKQRNQLRPVAQLKFQFYNPNPVGHRTTDGTTRALTKLLDMPWDAVMKLQCDYAMRCYSLPNDQDVLDALLQEQGFVRKEFPKHGVSMQDIVLREPAVLVNNGHWVYTDGVYYYDLNESHKAMLYHTYWVYRGDE